MKKFVLCFFIFFSIDCLCYNYNTKTLNPYNDKDFLKIDYSNYNSNLYVFDIENNLSVQIELPNDSRFNNYAINEINNLFAFVGEFNVYVYNYKTLNKVKEISLDNVLNYNDTKLSFSKKDNSLYCFSKSNLQIIKYDLNTGNKIDDYLFNANPKLYDDVFLNSFDDEFILMQNDTLFVYSLDNKLYKRNIPLQKEATDIRFYPFKDYFSYLVNGQIYLVKSSTGNLLATYNPSIGDYDSYDFSSSFNKILYYKDDTKTSFIADLITTEVKEFEFRTIFTNEEINKLIVAIPTSFYCYRVAEMPVMLDLYYLISYPIVKILSSSPSGYVHYPESMVINDNSTLFFVQGRPYSEINLKYNNALVNDKMEFIKTLNTEDEPIAFSPENKYLIFYNSTSFTYNFYNIAKDTIEATITSKLSLEFSKDQTKIFLYDSKKLEILEYPSLKLLSEINLQLIAQDINELEIINDILYIRSGNDFLSFDPNTNNLKKLFDFNELPQNAQYRLSPDGKYFLLIKSIENYQLYDYTKKSVVYEYKHTTSIYPQGFSVGFFGNSKLIHMFIADPFNGKDQNLIINLQTKETVGVKGDYLILSPDNLHYGSIYCPSFYSLKPIPIVVGVEYKFGSQSTNFISPNPASDYIEIKVGAIHELPLQEQFEIYNILGESLPPRLTSSDTPPYKGGEKIRVDISNLSPGVYFIKIGDKFEKFLKF